MRRHLILVLIALWPTVCVGAASASTQPAVQTPPGTAPDLIGMISALPGEQKTVISAPTVDAYEAYGPNATWKKVKAEDILGREALRVTVSKVGPDDWSAGANTKLTGTIAKDDVVFFAFLARAVEADNESQNGVLSTVAVQENAGDYTRVAQTAALVPLGEWQLYHGWGRADRALGPKNGMVAIHLGSAVQVVDLGPFLVLNLGPDVDTDALPAPSIDYAGREEDAAWRAAALARIERHRKGDLRIEVVDAAGAPVEGAEVRMRMTRNAFGFGTFVGHHLDDGDDPDIVRVRDHVREGFNLVTAPLYWHDWGWQDPEWRQSYIDTMAWLDAEGIPFRGHPLTWPVEKDVPDFVKTAGRKKDVANAVLGHVREVVEIARRYEPVAYDVWNEPHVGDYLPRIGGKDLPVRAFQLAHELDPDATLYINDYGMISGGGTNEEHLRFYEDWIADHIAKGAPIGGIGFQGHFGAALTHPARIVEILERFSRFGLPLQITEFDVDTQDEAAKADYLRDAMIAAYSVPAVDAFLIWGFWEGDHWRPRAAMIGKDWTPRPAWQRWLDMQAQWSTDERARAGADGSATVRGHHGDYAIEVRAPDGRRGEAAATLMGAGGTVRVVLD